MGLIGLIYLAAVSWGNLLVVEYKDPAQWEHHGQSVKHIACGNEDYACELYYSEDFGQSFTDDIVKLLNTQKLTKALGIYECVLYKGTRVKKTR